MLSGMARDPEKQRAAKRRYYERNPDVYRANNNRKRARLHQMVIEAKCVPCADCTRTFPFYVMDFDHRDPSAKDANISRIVVRGSLRQLQDELAKCDVVCANCHRVRSFIDPSV